MNKKTLKPMALILSLIFMLSVFMPAAYADDTNETVVTFTDSGASVSGPSDGLTVKGTNVKVNASGTYRFTGSCSQGSIVVKKNVKGVTLILDNLTLSASATAPITCNKGTQVNIVAAAGSVNNLADDKYNNDDVYTDETAYPDIENAVIKCKDGSNVIISGTGTINVNAYGKNGVKGGADLYEEDDDGNVTETLLSTASLTVKDVTLNVSIKHSYKDPDDANAYDGDAIKSEKELNILSGNITVSANDDGIKSDYTLNIGAEGTDGPTIKVTKSTEGIEAATLNVYSGNVSVNADDDGINAANSDLTGYSFSYNQYGGYVYVNCTNGDGIDSNGTINLNGGTLEVYSPSQGDGDPLDADGGTTFGGATVLAVGHNAMMQSYSAKTPYVTFGSSSGGGPGGFPGGLFGGPGRNDIQSDNSSDLFGGNSATTLVKAGSTITIKDSSGNTLYTATAVRDASYIVFASSALTNGTTYTLYSNDSQVATASATTSSSGGQPGLPGQPGQPGDNPGQEPGSDDNGNQEDENLFQKVTAFFSSVWAWIMSMINNITALF
jgi:hypothetical protein